MLFLAKLGALSALEALGVDTKPRRWMKDRVGGAKLEVGVAQMEAAEASNGGAKPEEAESAELTGDAPCKGCMTDRSCTRELGDLLTATGVTTEFRCSLERGVGIVGWLLHC